MIEKSRRRQVAVQMQVRLRRDEGRLGVDTDGVQRGDQQHRLVLAVAEAPAQGFRRGARHMGIHPVLDTEITHIFLNPLGDAGSLHQLVTIVQAAQQLAEIRRQCIVELVQAGGPVIDAGPVAVLGIFDVGIYRQPGGRAIFGLDRRGIEQLNRMAAQVALGSFADLRIGTLDAEMDIQLLRSQQADEQVFHRRTPAQCFPAESAPAEYRVGSAHGVAVLDHVVDPHILQNRQRGPALDVHVAVQLALLLEHFNIAHIQAAGFVAVAIHADIVDHQIFIGREEAETDIRDLLQPLLVQWLYRKVDKPLHFFAGQIDLGIGEHKADTLVAASIFAQIDSDRLHPVRARRLGKVIGSVDCRFRGRQR